MLKPTRPTLEELKRRGDKVMAEAKQAVEEARQAVKESNDAASGEVWGVAAFH